MTIPTPGGPTVRRIVVGSHLRRLREAKGITREDAGYAIRGSESKISRLELGRVGFKERDVVDLLHLYGVEEGERFDALVGLAREANAPGWWHEYDDVLASWFETYVGLEEAASLIRTYENQFVPGLLQTEEYARAIITSGLPGAAADEIEQRVQLRLQRQRLLTREDAPTLWAVVDEAALRRPIGGRAVLRDQMRRLQELTELPNVVVQIMPFRFGVHAAEGGAFSILRFEDAELPDVVYVEQLVSALYLDKREHVDRYAQTMERMTVDSQPPELTVETLSKLVAQL